MKKLRYKVIIQFNGSRYCGWQIQNQQTATVQSELNKALKSIFKEVIKTTGSGRTDAGVHAKQFHVVFNAPFEIPHLALVKALNGHLPADIRAVASSFVSADFRVTNDAIMKEYRYFFTCRVDGMPFSSKLMHNSRYDLDLARMNQACKIFVGTHDFKNFHCLGSSPNNTVRKIYECEVVFVAEDIMGLIPDHYYLRISGNGFLKQMVRLIMGAIWDVGRGKLDISDIEKALVADEFKHIAAVAPAGGLYKFSVEYAEGI